MKAELLGLIGLFVLYFYLHEALTQEEAQHERHGKCEFGELISELSNKKI